ncbi:hypothetical protein PAP_06675 [Palaeococcus pacificus DY20341]|uniref:Uncharacterized protein n=2 Tax=Palaeococcus TaxID=83867 RepID=A0A075LSK7_9EURY|nr:hypothetical protein PAP_06675 [Palaeococcus pacificus DY20341]
MVLLIAFSPLVSAKTLVVSSYQDETIARYLASYLNATVVLIPWGSRDVQYLEEIKSQNPDKLIIVGGIYAVPKDFEFGSFERYGGKDRLETAKIVLEYFFNFSSPSNIVVYPSKEAVWEYIKEGGEWEIVEGNSSVALRWSKLIQNELHKYSGKEKRLVLVGNVQNNALLNETWSEIGELPEVYTLYPSIVLMNGTLFITGSDENLPLIERFFEENKDVGGEDILKFSLLLLVLVLAFFVALDDRRFYLAALILTAVWVLYSIEAFVLAWDSLFVYFDGALSLSYLGHYETIIGGRGFPGLSYLFLAFFRVFSPTVESVILYQIFMLFLLLSSLFLFFKNKELAFISYLLILTIPLFRQYTYTISTELTFLTFLLLSLAFLRYKTAKSTILASASASLGALVRFQALILPLISLALFRDVYGILFILASLSFYFGLTFVTHRGFWGYISEASSKGITSSLVVSNAQFYLPKLLLNGFVPIVLLIWHFAKGKRGLTPVLSLAIFYALAPLVWVAQDERYLLPTLFLLALAAFEKLDEE